MEEDKIDGEVDGRVVCSEWGRESVIEEYDEEGFVVGEVVIRERVWFELVWVGEGWFEVGKVLKIKECVDCYLVFCLLFVI